MSGVQVRCEWGISPGQESLITSVVFVGTMAGAYSWGVLGDARGRRAGFFATAVFTFFFGAPSAFAPNYTVGMRLLLCMLGQRMSICLLGCFSRTSIPLSAACPVLV